MNVDEGIVLADVKRALTEDLGSGDVSAVLLPVGLWIKAEIISREPMLLCGQPWVNAVFRAFNPEIKVDWCREEGDWLDAATTVCEIEGWARDIVSAERTALNFLQTISGTATETHAFVTALGSSKTKLLDTRKTIPGLRYAQKYAVRMGGGHNHRMGLYDAFLIKENHITACGSLEAAIKKACDLSPDLFLEVEVENIRELKQALELKPDRILLDNFSLDAIQKAIALNDPKVCELELSGGINLSNIKQFANLGLDYISVGALTKSVRAIDLSLLIK